MKSKKETETKKVTVEPIKIGELNLKIQGTTPLLMEKMSDKVANELTAIMQGQGKDKRKNRDFESEVKDKIHYTPGGKVGFPSGGFKKAMVSAAPYMDGMDMKLARSIVVVGDMVEINSKPYIINKTIGRDSGRNRAPRPIWRPEFRDWTCTLKIRYNSSLITPEQIVGLCKLAGFHIGIGGWTPQHNGSYGMFTIAEK
jgi:hypothetical protein